MVAVLSSKVLPQLRMSVDEYLRAELPPGHRYELVDGVVEMTPAPAPYHDRPLHPLQEALYSYVHEHPRAFAHISQRSAMVIPRRITVREPDLALYREWPEDDESWSAWKRIKPFWVAEIVSKTRRKRDYEVKRREYWRAGVEEYWIVDTIERRVTVLARGDDDWIERVFGENERARSGALRDFSIPVGRLIRRRK